MDGFGGDVGGRLATESGGVGATAFALAGAAISTIGGWKRSGVVVFAEADEFGNA